MIYTELSTSDQVDVTPPPDGTSYLPSFEWRSSVPTMLSSDDWFRQSTTFQEATVLQNNTAITVTSRLDSLDLIKTPDQSHLNAVDTAALADARAKIQKIVKMTGVVQDWETNLANTVSQWDRWAEDEKTLTTPIVDHDQIAQAAADLAGRHDTLSPEVQQRDKAIGMRYGIAQEKLAGFLDSHPVADDWTAADHQAYARLQRHVAALGEQHIGLERQVMEGRIEKLVSLTHAAAEADARATWYAHGVFPDRGDQQVAVVGERPVVLTKQTFSAHKLAAMVDHAVDAKNTIDAQKNEFDEEDVKRASEGYPGYVWMLAGMPLTGMVVSTGSIIDNGTKWIKNDNARKWVRRGLKITAGGIYGLFGGAMAAGCTAPNVPDTGPKTLPPPGAKTEFSPTIRPTIIPTIVPTLTPAPPTAEYGKIAYAVGKIPGYGGPDMIMEEKKMTPPVLQNLTKQGYAPVVDSTGDVSAVMMRTKGTKSCVAPLRDQVFASDRVSVAGLSVNSGVATYTDSQDRTVLKMPAVVDMTGAPAGTQCIQAIKNDPKDKEFGALKFLLINSSDGSVLGQIPAFSGTDNVTVTQTALGSVLKVNGKETWFTTMTGQPIERVDLAKVEAKTWEECASKDSESANSLMWQAYNAYGEDRILKEAASYKASGKYKKPSLAADISRGSSAGGLAFGYSAYAEDALYIGNRPCLLPGSNFGYAKGVNISVEVDFYVPIDRLDRPFISIRKFTYPEGRFGTFFGIQDFLEASLLPDGRPYLKAQIGQKPVKGQVFRVGRATSMDEVDWYKNGKVSKGVVEISPDADGYYKAMGKDLLEILGLATRQEAQDVLGQPNAQFLYSDDQLNKLLEMINKRPITILKELILKKR